MRLSDTYSTEAHTMLALRLPEELEARLDALAKKTGRTKSYYAREALVEYIDDLEDLYLAQTRYALIEKGKSKTLSLDDAEVQIALDR
jgi:RHH-type rel operon transcriptional repressor/antitoxin RelB